MPQAADDIDYASLLAFRHAIARFLRFSAEAARAAGFEPQQHQLMLAVKGLPAGVSPTVGNLAEQLQIRHHSCVELINRLVASGHVDRRRNPSDRREVLVSLTPSGEAKLRELSRHHQAELQESGPALARMLLALASGARNEVAFEASTTNADSRQEGS